MSDIVRHLDEMVSATTVEALWELHKGKMESYGFDRLIYGFTRFGGQGSLGNPKDWLILSSQTCEYMRFFIEEGLYYNAPMLRWAIRNTGACSWRWLTQVDTERELTNAQRRVLEFNQQMDVTAGYTISFPTGSRRVKAAIALTARKGLSQDDIDEVWARHGTEIHLLNNVMHLKVQSLPYAGDNRLTKRQREVLEWVGDGKTIQDIAVLLDLTPATVEKHLRLARQALDVDTTPQAVLKAAFQNQMFVVD